MNWKFTPKCRTEEYRQFSKKIKRGLAIGYAAGSATIFATAAASSQGFTDDIATYSTAKIAGLGVMSFCLGWSVLYGHSLIDNEDKQSASGSKLNRATRAVLWFGLLAGIFGADLACLAFGIELGGSLMPVMTVGLVALIAIFAGLIWPIYKTAASMRGG